MREIVLELRSQRKISQERLSVEASMDRTFVSKIEMHGRNPRLLSVFRLAEALEMSPEELVRLIREKAEALPASLDEDEE